VGRKWGRVSYWRRRLRVIKLLGGKCCRCGNSDARVLQINHVNGGGSKETQIGKGEMGSSNFLIDIDKGRRSINDLNLMCANCNILYEYEVGRRYGLGKYRKLINAEGKGVTL
jgi:hypothetical protein